MIRLVAVLLAVLVSGSSVAQPESRFDVRFPVPDVREDGTRLDKEDIDHFNLYVVNEDGLELILPSIPYDNISEEVDEEIDVNVNDPEGEIDFCVKTVDKFAKEGEICSEVAVGEYIVTAPNPPVLVTVVQQSGIKIEVTVEVKND